MPEIPISNIVNPGSWHSVSHLENLHSGCNPKQSSRWCIVFGCFRTGVTTVTFVIEKICWISEPVTTVLAAEAST